jgi:class 3 adenylate cyclase
MTLKTDLEAACAATFKTAWNITDGTVVPDTADIALGNSGRNLDVAVLYADLADSTVMVDTKLASFAAEIYKAFLYCAARIIRANGGEITSYDGDRVMAVYVGDKKCTRAVKTALQLNWAVKNIVRVKMSAQYPNSTFVVNHVCGIDTSKVLVARTGIRGSNDLVWVGRAANYAAKLSALSHARPTYITAEVYNMMADEAKYSSGTDMWVKYKWNTFDDREIYGSTYWWSFE